jgi:heptose-I-phosphate ethanolaminephosphotransferase
MNGMDFWVIFDTDLKEAKGFLSSQYLSVKNSGYIIAYFLLFVFFFYKTLVHPSVPTNRYGGMLFAVIVVFVSSVYPFKSTVTAIDFYRSLYGYTRDIRDVKDFYRKKKDIHYDVSSGLNDKIPKTFVIVIGESVNRNHLSLYGYPRTTNPKLQTIRNQLLIYDNVTSPSTGTLPVLRDVLTFANYEKPKLYKEDASIIELVRDAGYKTYWIDKQGKERSNFRSNSYRRIAKSADEYICPIHEKLDESIISHLRNAMKDTAQNKIIFIHLMGSHLPYADKSPQQFKIFNSKNDTVISVFADRLGAKEKQTIDEYDASILYNDFVVYSIVKLLQEETGASFMLYFSDHGEEIFDSQFFSGRSFNRLSRGMCEIPFILWYNDGFSDINKDIQYVPHCPYSTDDVIHSILYLMKINYALFEEERCIFSPKFREKTRKVGVYYYNELK